MAPPVTSIGFDPTFYWTKRGRHAIQTISSRSVADLYAPHSVVENDPVLADVYFQRSAYGIRFHEDAPPIPQGLRAMRADPKFVELGIEPVGRAKVGAEIWSMLENGSAVMARRQVALTGLLCAGIEIRMVRATTALDRQLDSQIDPLIGEELRAMLLRRTRYVFYGGDVDKRLVRVIDRSEASFY